MIRMAETNVLSYVLADPSDASKYAGSLLSCLRTIKSSTEVTHYVLTKILEVLNSSDVVSNPARLFFDQSDGTFTLNYDPFKHCLTHRDGWIVKASGVAAAFILTQGMKSGCSNVETLSHMIEHVCGKMQGPSQGLVNVVPALGVLVKDESAKVAMGRSGGVGYVARHLRGSGEGEKLGAQTVYELGFCLWTMTYSSKLRGDFGKGDVVEVMCDIVKKAQREKVVRVIAAALLNLAKDGEDEEGGTGTRKR